MSLNQSCDSVPFVHQRYVYFAINCDSNVIVIILQYFQLSNVDEDNCASENRIIALRLLFSFCQAQPSLNPSVRNSFKCNEGRYCQARFSGGSKLLPVRVGKVPGRSSPEVQTLEILWATTVKNCPKLSSTPITSLASSISSPLGQVEFLRRSTGQIRKPGSNLLQSRKERRFERATRLQPTPRETSLPKTVSSC